MKYGTWGMWCYQVKTNVQLKNDEYKSPERWHGVMKRNVGWFCWILLGALFLHLSLFTYTVILRMYLNEDMRVKNPIVNWSVIQHSNHYLTSRFFRGQFPKNNFKFLVKHPWNDVIALLVTALKGSICSNVFIWSNNIK